MKVAKQYAKLRDEQFSLYEHYARQHGMNYKGLLIHLWLYNSPKMYFVKNTLREDLFNEAGGSCHYSRLSSKLKILQKKR